MSYDEGERQKKDLYRQRIRKGRRGNEEKKYRKRKGDRERMFPTLVMNGKWWMNVWMDGWMEWLGR